MFLSENITPSPSLTICRSVAKDFQSKCTLLCLSVFIHTYTIHVHQFLPLKQIFWSIAGCGMVEHSWFWRFWTEPKKPCQSRENHGRPASNIYSPEKLAFFHGCIAWFHLINFQREYVKRARFNYNLHGEGKIFQQSPFLYKVDPYQLQMGYNL